MINRNKNKERFEVLITAVQLDKTEQKQVGYKNPIRNGNKFQDLVAIYKLLKVINLTMIKTL